MEFEISQEEIKRNDIVDVGWYRLEVVACNTARAKKSGALMDVMDFKVSGGEFDGTPLKTWFVQGYEGNLISYAKAFGADIKAARKAGTAVKFDPASTVGKQVEAYITPELDDKGVQRNTIKDYAPLGTNIK